MRRPSRKPCRQLDQRGCQPNARFAFSFEAPRICVIIATTASPATRRASHAGTFRGAFVLAFTLAIGAPVFAEEAHHAPGSIQTQVQPTSPQVQPQTRGKGMMGQGMMGLGGMMGSGGMSGMMPMMGMMRMMHGGAHIDGRLAFIKAELKITSAQERAWDDFATALRQAAAKVREASPAMHAMSGMVGPATPPQLLEQHEKQLTAQLEAIRIVKPALVSFYAGLSEDQKKTLAQVHPMFRGMF